MTDNTNTGIDTQPMFDIIEKIPTQHVVGLLSNYPESYETRLLLTPEGVGMLTSAGFRVMVEAGAGVDVNYSDDAYAEYGAEIVDRDKALKAQLVLSYSPLYAADVRKMDDGATLLCMMGHQLLEKDTILALLDKKIICGCLDNMYSHAETAIFADILDELDGRAAVMYAEEALSFLGGGKGVLLGSVAGLNPCEVMILGSGKVVESAACAAASTGAKVTIMDNDISSLASMKKHCGIFASMIDFISIHPRVLFNRIKTADVIFRGTCTRPFELPKNLMAAMKESVYMLDFNESHPSVSVPRTVTMAITNVMVNFLDEFANKGGFNGVVSTTPGVQNGIVTYRGHLVDKLVASYLSMPSVDISVMLTATN